MIKTKTPPHNQHWILRHKSHSNSNRKLTKGTLDIFMTLHDICIFCINSLMLHCAGSVLFCACVTTGHWIKMFYMKLFMCPWMFGERMYGKMMFRTDRVLKRAVKCECVEEISDSILHYTIGVNGSVVIWIWKAVVGWSTQLERVTHTFVCWKISKYCGRHFSFFISLWNMFKKKHEVVSTSSEHL